MVTTHEVNFMLVILLIPNVLAEFALITESTLYVLDAVPNVSCAPVSEIAGITTVTEPVFIAKLYCNALASLLQD